MSKPSKHFFSAILILLIGICSQQIYAQRCGGDMRYLVRDDAGAIGLLNEPTKLSVKYVRINGIDNAAGPLKDYEFKDFAADGDGIRIVRISTGCGLGFAEIGLQFEGKLMVLRFHKIPAELNFFVDSLPFQEGIFEIDFKGDMWLKNVELNLEGVKNKEGKLVLHGTAQSRGLVSVNNWKKREIEE